MQKLNFKSVLENQDIVSKPVFEFAQSVKNGDEVLVAKIDPKFMGGKELCDEFGVDPKMGANCVVVEASGKETSEFVAVVVPVGYRADLNGFVKKHLGVRRVSLASLEKVIEQTQMEYGSITPFGLPSSWKILMDSRIFENDAIIVGGGKQISKLLVPTKVFKNIPNVEIIPDLGKPF